MGLGRIEPDMHAAKPYVEARKNDEAFIKAVQRRNTNDAVSHIILNSLIPKDPFEDEVKAGIAQLVQNIISEERKNNPTDIEAGLMDMSYDGGDSLRER